VTTKVKISVEIHHELAQELERYRAYYRQAYNADVTDADLLREMARRFMEADGGFQEFKKGAPRRSRPARTPAAPARQEVSAS
jgi:hypothetical protein